jgi:hypothetical protein
MDKPDNLDGWPDPKFHENQNKFPVEELWKYAGQQVAWSWDGTRILAAAPDDAQLFQKLAELGIDFQRVVFDYVPDPDKSYFG